MIGNIHGSLRSLSLPELDGVASTAEYSSDRQRRSTTLNVFLLTNILSPEAANDKWGHQRGKNHPRTTIPVHCISKLNGQSNGPHKKYVFTIGKIKHSNILYKEMGLKTLSA